MKVDYSKAFSITSVTREDLENAGFDVSGVSDETMERLAIKLCDDYCEQLFWISLGIFAGDMGIPKKTTKKRITMAMKAYLVTFTATTRVVVDVPEDFDPNNCNLIIREDREAYDSIIREARENILKNPEGYVYGDNAEIEEDTECPYGTFDGED